MISSLSRSMRYTLIIEQCLENIYVTIPSNHFDNENDHLKSNGFFVQICTKTVTTPSNSYSYYILKHLISSSNLSPIRAVKVVLDWLFEITSQDTKLNLNSLLTFPKPRI